MRSVLLSLALLVSCSCRTFPPPAPAEVDRDPKEPGSWMVCYDALGAVVDYDGDCEDAQEINWGKLPIRLHIDPSYPDRGKTVLQAVRVWNGWLGTDVFFVTQNPVGADVVVRYQMGNLWDPAGMAEHVLRNGRPAFTVTMYGAYHNSTVIVAHELGHVMGLAHDPGRVRSVMHPSGEWYVPWLTKKDCRRLRQKYGLNPGSC